MLGFYYSLIIDPLPSMHRPIFFASPPNSPAVEAQNKKPTPKRPQQPVNKCSKAPNPTKLSDSKKTAPSLPARKPYVPKPRQPISGPVGRAKSKQSVSIQTDERERCDQESQTYSGGPRCDQAVQTIAEKTIQYVQEDGSPIILPAPPTLLSDKNE
ncbi:hypothetical protein DdX_06131 [Ditylenchus destructor]|uniref:Uncharacterized protein n=1 Tax=Ditylenchus destructor TaxID=166010 RepID=A0AAD4NBU8_9BILA|nr:hypothetical protein DdX_06131 [Ditylenchus destructor]